MCCYNLSGFHSPVYVPHDIPGQVLAQLFVNTKSEDVFQHRDCGMIPINRTEFSYLTARQL